MSFIRHLSFEPCGKVKILSPNSKRVASESAHGTGRLNGMIQLTEVLQNMEKLEITAVKCFTDNIYADDVKKWSFDKDKHQEVRIITVLTLISTTPDKAPPQSKSRI